MAIAVWLQILTKFRFMRIYRTSKSPDRLSGERRGAERSAGRGKCVEWCEATITNIKWVRLLTYPLTGNRILPFKFKQQITRRFSLIFLIPNKPVCSSFKTEQLAQFGKTRTNYNGHAHCVCSCKPQTDMTYHFGANLFFILTTSAPNALALPHRSLSVLMMFDVAVAALRHYRMRGSTQKPSYEPAQGCDPGNG